MPDDLDTRLRRLAGNLVEGAPNAPPLDAVLEQSTTRPVEALRQNTRSSSRRWLAAAALLLVTAGATVIAVSAARSSKEVTSAGPTGSVAIDSSLPSATVPATVLPTIDSDPLVSCAIGLPNRFRASALQGPLGAENADDPAAKALRDYEQGWSLDGQGWRLLQREDHRAVYASGTPPKMFAIVEERAGVWTVGPSSTGDQVCTPFITSDQPGVQLASWTLDPSAPPDPASSELHILVEEMACHGSESTDPTRIRAPEVRMDTERVVILVSLVPLATDGAGVTCPGPPPTPYVVRLPEPLGNRVIADGVNFPPRVLATNGGAPATTRTTMSEADRSQVARFLCGRIKGDYTVAAALPATVAQVKAWRRIIEPGSVGSTTNGEAQHPDDELVGFCYLDGPVPAPVPPGVPQPDRQLTIAFDDGTQMMLVAAQQGALHTDPPPAP